MPTGTASKNGAISTTDGRDALDAAIKRSLQSRSAAGAAVARSAAGAAPVRSQGRPPQPSQRLPSSFHSPQTSPQSDAALDDSLLGYIDGSLDSQAHAAFEKRLLAEDSVREKVVLLKSALAEASLGEPEAAPAAEADAKAQAGAEARARYVFHFIQGTLFFLHGSEPCDGADENGAFHFTHPFGFRFISLRVWCTGAAGTANRLNLALSGKERQQPLCAQVHLYNGPTEIAQRALLPSNDANPAVVFADLPGGHYELRVVPSTGEVVKIIVDCA